MDLEMSGAAASLESSVDAPTGFAPGSRKGTALGDDVTSEVKLVAGAGAKQVEVQARAAGAYGVSRTASDTLGRPVLKGDDAVTGPRAGHAREWTRLRVARGSEN